MTLATRDNPDLRIATYEEVCGHLRVDEDQLPEAMYQLLIDAATDYAEESLSSTLLPRLITVTFDRPEHEHDLPRGPVQGIVSLNGEDVVNFTGDVDLRPHARSDRLRLRGMTYPATVVYRAGYPTIAQIPASIRHAILCHVGSLYAVRESIADKSLTPVPHQLADFYRLHSRFSGVM